ncbi:PREDICTED: uncharacterized protein LOC104819576 [Tarenaya hassleriana]|uniref:uncharacterized protein LOC104819576 n=1 Tax=Tarenaya hassleriana TaxID=28532 RepID=UPI00053C9118|nr:PREDICTED: uncharacterized protein LOC104819576 [Tarenaya hassleriana]
MAKRIALPSQSPPPPPLPPLFKQHSWSQDVYRDEAWMRKTEKRPFSSSISGGGGLARSKSVTDDDLEELRGCIELGFGFGPDSPDLDPRLSDTLPALGFYCAVNRQYSSRLSRTSSLSSIASEGDVSNSSSTIFDQGDDPETVKLRLKQWAQVVACSVRQFSGEPN